MAGEGFTTIAQALREQARMRPDKAAVIFEGETTTYRELDRRSDAVAARLCEAGVEPGDRVAVLARNSARYVDILFGIAKARAIATPLNLRLAPPEIAYIVEDADAKVLVLDPALQGLAPSRADLRTLSLDEATAPTDAPAPADGDPRDVAFLLYTSGTTGQPKGVMLPNATFARHWGLDDPAIPAFAAMTSADVALAVLPLFHVGGIEFLLRPLLNGATVVMHKDFDVARILEDTQRHRVTVQGLVPTALQMVLAHPRCAETDFSSVRLFFYGASPIPIGLLKEGLARFTCDFVQVYGMTETCGTCVMLAPEDHGDLDAPKLRAAGRARPNAQIRIVDGEGRVLPTGEIGEIVIRGPQVMSGYWRRPEATAATLGPDGWLRSGDAGRLDAEGYLYVHDRVKDMIITGGENVYPAEVESAIYGHPCVAEVAVIGVPDPVWVEAVKAVVVLKPDAAFDADDLIAWARARIAGFKAPKSVDVVGELPKNAAGKILRRTIREGYWRDQDRAVG